MTITEFQALLDIGSPAAPPTGFTPDGHELETLLSPLSCAEFASTWFARLSLHVAGNPQKFDPIFGWDRLRQALASGRRVTDERYNITASFTAGEVAGNNRPMQRASHDQVSGLLKAGATICITNIHMADPGLARWAQAIRAQLCFTGTVGVNCYVSPDGSGLPMHYDKRVATTLQIAGRKLWRFSTEAAKEWPDHNAVFSQGRIEPPGIDGGRLPDEMEFREVELQAGDLLCLPAGAWHSARGVGESLALNLYFAPRNAMELLVPMLQSFAAANGAWRGGPPPSVAEVRGRLPEDVLDYLRERINELLAMARESREHPQAALAEPWLNALTRAPYTGWQPEHPLPIPSIAPEQRFRIAPSSLRFVEVADGIVVPCDKGLLKFPAAVASIFHRLASEPPGFTVPVVLSWLPESGPTSRENVLNYLQTLYANGVLEMV